MSQFLLVLVLVSVVVIFLLWWSSTWFVVGSDDSLRLDTTDAALVDAWYKEYTGPFPGMNMDERIMAQTLLYDLRGIHMDKDYILIEDDLDKLNEKHIELTGRTVSSENVFHMRELIGLPGVICIVQDRSIRERLTKQLEHDTCYDARYANLIIEKDLHKAGNEYITAALEKRWQLLSAIYGDRLTNNHDGYAYLDKNVTPPNKTVFGDTKGKSLWRINMLCSDKEFDALLKRARLLRSPGFLRDS